MRRQGENVARVAPPKFVAVLATLLVLASLVANLMFDYPREPSEASTVATEPAPPAQSR